MMKCLLLINSVIWWGCLNISAQEEHSLQLEQWTEQQGREWELDDIDTELDQWRGKTIPVNELQTEHLVAFGLSPIQVKSFQWYCLVFGRILDRYELQAIPYWDSSTIRKIVPLLDFSDAYARPMSSNKIWKEGAHEVLFRTSSLLEKARGFSVDSSGDRKYPGSPLRMFYRYKFQVPGSVWMGFSMEKDTGEEFGRKLSGMVDFSGWHLFAKGKKLVRGIAIGDFAVNAGQGLTVWQGMAFGKGAEGAGVFRQGALLKPYRSAGESNFFRGLAIHLGKGKWEWLGWLSVKRRSASLQFIQDTAVFFSSLSESGYHRTETELAGRKKIGETVVGSVVRWQSDFLKIGWNTYFQRFSLPWYPQWELYNQHYFRGDRSFHSSVDYSFGKKQFFFFGEFALGGKGRALVQGALATLSSKVDWAILYRNIQPAYHSIYASAFTEQSAVRNEEGIYSSWQIRPGVGWMVKLYADFYRFPWLRFRTDAPSGGREARLLLQWEKRRQWTVYGFIRVQAKQENSAGQVTHAIVPVAQQNFRFHVQRTWGRKWIFTGRTDLLWYHKMQDRQRGIGAFVDSKYQLSATGWQLIGRLQWFQTGGYASRIYSFERDLLYSYSVPAVYDHGWRYYLQWQGKFTKKWWAGGTVKWWLRWSQTIYTNKQVSGSGWDEISGNRRSEWKFQLLFDW